MIRYIRLIFIINLVFLLASCSKPETPPAAKVKEGNPNEWMIKGLEYFVKDDFEKAIECYDKAIELKPDLFTAYHHKGEALFYLKHYEEAEKAFLKVVEIEPNNVESWSMLGMAALEMGQESKAKKAFLEVEKLDPEMGALMKEMHNAFMEKKKAEGSAAY